MLEYISEDIDISSDDSDQESSYAENSDKSNSAEEN